METFILNFQLYLIIIFRIYAMLQTAPLFSSGSVPQAAKIGICLFTAVVLFPGVQQRGYALPEDFISYGLLLVGEALIGIIIGFFLTLIYSAFQVAGELFSLQMGFGASEVFDPLAQIEIPILGQFFNLVAMYVFVLTGGFQKFMLVGVHNSFMAVRAIDFVQAHDKVIQLIYTALGGLFESALVISFPVLGTLFLVSVSMGLLSKAAPQMNLMMMGFPVSISVAFLLILVSIPFLMETFSRLVDLSFEGMQRIIGVMMPKT